MGQSIQNKTNTTVAGFPELIAKELQKWADRRIQKKSNGGYSGCYRFKYS